MPVAEDKDKTEQTREPRSALTEEQIESRLAELTKQIMDLIERTRRGMMGPILSNSPQTREIVLLQSEQALLAQEQEMLRLRQRRGPAPGTGGRPPKAGTRRVTRGVNMTPETWAMIEESRLPGESLGDVVERLLKKPR